MDQADAVQERCAKSCCFPSCALRGESYKCLAPPISYRTNASRSEPFTKVTCGYMGKEVSRFNALATLRLRVGAFSGV